MIDSTAEEIFPLADAPKRKCFPVRPGGRRIHVSTLYRWAQHGLRGVRLETIQVGGTRCTSARALQRFFQALGNRDVVPVPDAASKARRVRAEQVLDNAGI